MTNSTPDSTTDLSWRTLASRRLSRRAMLGWSARAGVGAAGIALVGCGDDDNDETDSGDTESASVVAENDTSTDDQAEPEVDDQADDAAAQSEADDAPASDDAEDDAEDVAEDEPEPAPAETAPGKIVISAVELSGADATVVLSNMTADSINLDGWYLCQFPSYWPIPAIDLPAGGSITASAAGGENDAETIFAGGGFGSLTGGGAGEIALYRSSDFGSATAIVSYIGWNGGQRRKTVAQQAGIWGNSDLDLADGASITYTGGGIGADGYSVS